MQTSMVIVLMVYAALLGFGVGWIVALKVAWRSLKKALRDQQ